MIGIMLQICMIPYLTKLRARRIPTPSYHMIPATTATTSRITLSEKEIFLFSNLLIIEIIKFSQEEIASYLLKKGGEGGVGRWIRAIKLQHSKFRNFR